MEFLSEESVWTTKTTCSSRSKKLLFPPSRWSAKSQRKYDKFSWMRVAITNCCDWGGSNMKYLYKGNFRNHDNHVLLSKSWNSQWRSYFNFEAELRALILWVFHWLSTKKSTVFVFPMLIMVGNLKRSYISANAIYHCEIICVQRNQIEKIIFWIFGHLHQFKFAQ